MTFSGQAKKEICGREARRLCCVQAACYGIACFGRYFDARGVVLHTENAFVAQAAKTLYAAAGIKGKVYAKGAEGSRTYEFSVKDPFEVEKMLAMFGHTGEETALRIRPENFECEECLRYFAGAAFISCGTMVTPEKGYMLEFVGGRYGLMQDFAQLLEGAGFAPKRTVRKGANVLYFKSSEQIEDMLTFMGASTRAMDVMNLKAYKEVRNTANRVTNCETANIDKTVAANRAALRAINLLEKHGALDTLPPPLLATAQLRRQNPDLTLAELVEASPEPVSKSGLSHRIRKLIDLAKRYEDAPAQG